jgi:hypothetical protein
LTIRETKRDLDIKMGSILLLVAEDYRFSSRRSLPSGVPESVAVNMENACSGERFLNNENWIGELKTPTEHSKLSAKSQHSLTNDLMRLCHRKCLICDSSSGIEKKSMLFK